MLKDISIMSRIPLIAILSLTMASSGILTSWAQSSQQVNNPTTPSTTRPYMVKVNMKPEQMAMLATIMRSGKNYCFLQDLDPGDDSSMVLICQASIPPTVTFVP
jgi:hypothetical protein